MSSDGLLHHLDLIGKVKDEQSLALAVLRIEGLIDRKPISISWMDLPGGGIIYGVRWGFKSVVEMQLFKTTSERELGKTLVMTPRRAGKPQTVHA
jgi:hypothetical protein